MVTSVARFCIIFTLLVAAYSVNAAVYTVTKVADTNDGSCSSDCSLREAVGAANATADNDTIIFALPFFSSPRTIVLSGSEIVFANNGTLTIFGTGANRLTISGNNASRIFASGANVVVNIHHIRFTGGNGAGAINTGRGGAIYNVGGTMLLTNSVLIGNSAANGGAINNASSASPSPVVAANLTIDNCFITNNNSTSSGSAMQNFSTSTLHLRNSTVSNNNSSNTGIAGAIQANGTVTITNSTFSGNTAPSGTGGGVYYNGTSLIVTNSTLSFNSAGVGGGGFHRTGTNPTAFFRNTIVSNNAGASGSPDAAGLISSLGNNVIQNVTGSTGWIGSDQQGVDPRLAPLGAYGGIPMTQVPLSPSPAIDMGQNCVVDQTCATPNAPVAVATDERGAKRPAGANVDVGAVELSNIYRARMPSATLGVPYNHIITANNGPTTYTVSGGTLPAGLTLTNGATTASVNGTPTQRGSFRFIIIVEALPFTDPGEKYVPEATANINYDLAVLADPTIVSVSGQVVTAAGEPVGKAYVTLTGLDGQVHNTITSPFGYFRFDGVPAGLHGILSIANKKGVSFDDVPIAIIEVIDDFEIRAQP